VIPPLEIQSFIRFAWLATALAVGGTVSASENGFSLDSFASLDPDDQAAVVRIAMEERLEFAKNIHYESERELRVQEIINGAPGKVMYDGTKLVHRHWRLGDSYRMDTDQYESKASLTPVKLVQNQFDAIQGVSRGRVNGPINGRIFARIDTKHDPFNAENRYAYWLDGEATFDGEFLIRYLVDHAYQYEIEVENDTQQVRLTVPWMPQHRRTEILGERTVWLDPGKMLLPVKGKARWDDGSMWRTEEFVVLDAQLVGSVWMPMKIRELIKTDRSDDGVFNVIVTTVQKIEQGAVTSDDLRVDFPPGTEVVHAIEGIAYKIGPNGERFDTEPLMVGNTFVKAEQEAVQSNTATSYAFIIANLIGLVVVVGFYVRLRRSAQQGT